MKEITPLIICGGNGTRLWPISRTHSPKQFQRVGDAASLTFFQSAVERHSGEGFGTPLIVSSAKHGRTLHRHSGRCESLGDVARPVGQRHEAGLESRRGQVDALLEHRRKELPEASIVGLLRVRVAADRAGMEEEAQHATGEIR